jgi:hypothetical protein
MKLWEHVDDEITREVLGQESIDAESICHALCFVDQCCQADQHNEDVTDEMYTARLEACMDAHFAWNEEGDTLQTIEALQRFFSV